MTPIDAHSWPGRRAQRRRAPGVLMVSVLVVLAVPALGARQAPDRAVTEAMTRIYRLPDYSAFDWISARYLKGSLTLEGFVRTPQLRAAAEQAARGAPGIDEVFNRLEVLPAHGSDDTIRLQAYRAIYGGASLERYAPRGQLSAADLDDLNQSRVFGIDAVSVTRGPHAMHIVVNGSRVLLLGRVRSTADRQIAEATVRTIAGVSGVTNQIRVVGQR